ncbi:RNA polymerase-binding protein RbpA [soil metagenome]
MAERSLRGARLGTQSFEDERGVEMAPRQEIEYVTENGRHFVVVMADEADIPGEWEDPRTGQIGRLVNGEAVEKKAEKPVRSHWDMLLERRSVDELEEILTERLELLRAGEIGPVHLHRRGKAKKSA